MSAALVIRLSRSERERLERRQRRDRNAAVVRRITVVLLSDKGGAVKDICLATGVGPATVTNVRRRWIEERFDSLEERPRSGRPPKADGTYLAALLEAVNRPPSADGYGFSLWTAARLAEHLDRKTGTRLAADSVRRHLHAMGYRFNRPKHTLQGKRDEAEYTRGKAQLQHLKKGAADKTRPTKSSFSTKRASTSTRIWHGVGNVAANR